MFEINDLPDLATLNKLAARFPELEISSLDAWLTLMRVAGDGMMALDQFLAGHDLTQRRFFVLILLFRNPDGLAVSRLAGGTGVSCPTMTGVVEGLLKAGHVTRDPDPSDRRAFVVRITEQGKQVLNGVLPGHYSRVRTIMSHLDEDERSDLKRLLGKVREGLRKSQEQISD